MTRSSAPASDPVSVFWLDELEIERFHCDYYGTAKRNRAHGGGPLTIAGRRFERGVGVWAGAELRLRLEGAGPGARLRAWVGIDDQAVGMRPPARAGARFLLVGDGRVLWSSPMLDEGQPACEVDVDLAGVRELELLVEGAGRGYAIDCADWAEARFEGLAAAPTPAPPPKPQILTPPPPAAPRINGPRIVGARPGSPFLYTIPATGRRPMRFEARELPAGLSLDAATGRIDGCVARAGEYRATLLARNELGTTERELRIVIGDKICLTPPLGWNSWNCWARSVDDARIRASARALAQSDLINHGWSYINIDDTWQGVRGGLANALQPNAKFPDMKGLVDFIHALGLKAGIYSTPWMVSYGRHLGGSADIAGFTYQEPPSDAEWQAERWNYHKIGKIHYDQADAAQWADWGFDYLKYDWFANDLDSTERMSRALAATGRDIVYSLSNRAAYAHAARYAELANLWRTTRDIVDVWPCLKEIGFNEMKWRDHQGPGHWNDPDMLVVGNIGWSDRLRPTRLTPDEQYTHISLWCLLAAPLLIGCPLDQLDDFTLSLLTNDEVLDVDQDPLGAQGMPVSFDAPRIVYVKPLEDGSFAMGLFNTGHAPERVVATWPALGLAGPHRVRDLWRQTDLGVFDCAFEADVPRHGVVLVRVFRAENG